ncbi:MAG: hypothetical protein AAFQ29_08930 [Pseudomonadota bacterium]
MSLLSAKHIVTAFVLSFGFIATAIYSYFSSHPEIMMFCRAGVIITSSSLLIIQAVMDIRAPDFENPDTSMRKQSKQGYMPPLKRKALDIERKIQYENFLKYKNKYLAISIFVFFSLITAEIISITHMLKYH